MASDEQDRAKQLADAVEIIGGEAYDIRPQGLSSCPKTIKPSDENLATLEAWLRENVKHPDGMPRQCVEEHHGRFHVDWAEWLADNEKGYLGVVIATANADTEAEAREIAALEAVVAKQQDQKREPKPTG